MTYRSNFRLVLEVTIYRGLQGLTKGEYGKDFGLALGVFDGVHLGHQAVIDAARGVGRIGVLSFDPHPVEVLAPGKAPRKIIASLAHQERILKDIGVDFLVVVEFTREFANVAGRDFAENLFATGARKLAAGHDWSFGKNRSGSIDLLKEWADGADGVEVVKVDPLAAGGERISSSRIRAALQKGDLKKAADLLGRNYSVYGKVKQGKQLGRQLGFPTANVEVVEDFLPANGVYAIFAKWSGEWIPGVANVGTRPTVDDSMRRSLEVHLFSEKVPDDYGWMLEVGFQRKIRDERKFDGIEDLKAQIAKDSAEARGG